MDFFGLKGENKAIFASFFAQAAPKSQNLSTLCKQNTPVHDF